MIGKVWKWFKGWFVENTLDVYKPSERLIYRYWNGEKWVLADPLPLYKRVKDVWPELCIDIKVSCSTLMSEKEVSKASAKVSKSIRGIFDIKPLVNDFQLPDSGTLLDVEVSALLDHFLTFTETLKKNSAVTVTPATVQSPNTVFSPAESQPTPNGLDSGSTKSEKDSEEQTPLPLESASPLD